MDEMDVFVRSFRNLISGLHKTCRKDFSDNLSYSMTELETIGLIYLNEKILPSELAVKTKITTPSMSQILKRLENTGIIVRTPDMEDRRKVWVSLTEEGKKLVQQSGFSKDKTLKELIENRLTEEEIASLKEVMPILEKLNA